MEEGLGLKIEGYVQLIFQYGFQFRSMVQGLRLN